MAALAFLPNDMAEVNRWNLPSSPLAALPPHDVRLSFAYAGNDRPYLNGGVRVHAGAGPGGGVGAGGGVGGVGGPAEQEKLNARSRPVPPHFSAGAAWHGVAWHSLRGRVWLRADAVARSAVPPQKQ